MQLNKILELGDLKNYKLHAARKNTENEDPLHAYLKSQETWDGWQKWRGGKNDFNRRYIISFIQMSRDIWLFGGIYEVLGQSEKEYDVKLLDKGQDLIGRLKIQLFLSRGRAFLLENCYDKITVSEVLREPYNGEPFPGYNKVSLDWHKLSYIFQKERPDWKSALVNVKGIYLLADRKTGKKYVGKADGASGIWGRWATYMDTAHGGNKSLIELSIEKSPQYMAENFRITLLECCSLENTKDEIEKRENYWKEALLTRKEFGYNNN